MTEVTFHSGVDEFDARLGNDHPLGLVFDALNLGHIHRNTKKVAGQPLLAATKIEVAPYTNIDNQMAYAIRSFAELDNGRILLSDFVINQLWKDNGDKQTMSLVEEDGSVISDDMKELTAPLAFFADTYRISHAIKLMDE